MTHLIFSFIAVSLIGSANAVASQSVGDQFVSGQAGAPLRESCVVQMLKNNSAGQKAHYVLACGTETLATENITPLNEQTEAEVAKLKADLLTTVRESVGGNPTCFESESEIFWIGICHH